jgi:hypothetical protein
MPAIITMDNGLFEKSHRIMWKQIYDSDYPHLKYSSLLLSSLDKIKRNKIIQLSPSLLLAKEFSCFACGAAYDDDLRHHHSIVNSFPQDYELSPVYWGRNCKLCPVIWSKDKLTTTSSSEHICLRHDSPFRKWCDCNADQEEARRWALKIAGLTWINRR